MAAGPPNGKLVVLLHGFPEFWYGWRCQLGPLAAAGLRVVAPDLRGYNLFTKPEGISAYLLDVLADDVLGLADALGRRRFAIVGHDWGGVLAWHLAARDPGRIERAVILNAPHLATMRAFTARHPSQLARSWYVAFFQLPGLPERMLRAGDYAWLANGLTGSSRPGTFSDADLAQYRRAWSQPGALTAMLAWYRAVRLKQPPTTPPWVEVPVKVIWGDRDRFLDHRLAEAGIAVCEHGEVHHLRQASHWVQHEEPDEVNRLLLPASSPERSTAVANWAKIESPGSEGDMVKLLGMAFVVALACTLAGPARAEDPAQTMDDLLEELSDRQDEPLAAVLAELRAECEEGDEDEACAVTALRPFLLEPLPEPTE